ncbi:hypothetical protein C810_01526 [Lachnospiraceae bacterium A2]|nr:hypothetical protein C810_01526 [Lachnospiraceae bacterium A2]
MSQEIKFRGKRIDNGEWVEGYYAKHGSRHWIYTGQIQYMYYPACADLPTKYEVDPSTVGQYIGVNDKNGKEIYEDDIVLSDDGKVGQVQWFEEHLAFMIWCVTDNKVYFAYENDFSKIEVIGNVYENADLLKEAGNE